MEQLQENDIQGEGIDTKPFSTVAKISEPSGRASKIDLIDIKAN